MSKKRHELKKRERERQHKKEREASLDVWLLSPSQK